MSSSFHHGNSRSDWWLVIASDDNCFLVCERNISYMWILNRVDRHRKYSCETIHMIHMQRDWEQREENVHHVTCAIVSHVTIDRRFFKAFVYYFHQLCFLHWLFCLECTRKIYIVYYENHVEHTQCISIISILTISNTSICETNVTLVRKTPREREREREREM
jgi:hypothetical protein